MLEQLSRDFKAHTNVEIRCDSTPGSLKGRKFNDKFITVGWYTYVPGENELYGHTNCMVSAYINGAEGYKLKEMFDRAFDRLWNATRYRIRREGSARVQADNQRNAEKPTKLIRALHGRYD